MYSSVKINNNLIKRFSFNLWKKNLLYNNI
jgi:hypothetical protein